MSNGGESPHYFSMSYDLFPPVYLPCGGVAYYDTSSGISYRCECGSVVGSIGQSQSCKDEAKKYEVWEQLGGKGWDYELGCPKS